MKKGLIRQDNQAADVGILLADFASGALGINDYRAMIALRKSVIALLAREEKKEKELVND